VQSGALRLADRFAIRNGERDVEVNGCLHAGVEEFEYFFTGDEVVPHGVLADNVKAQENKKVKAR